ncbi:MAG: hypothetical protein JWM35_2509 [Verrucomicrobia bacterium]|nr:hypothetical protein [Verrucomicrobiota bacterium]
MRLDVAGGGEPRDLVDTEGFRDEWDMKIMEARKTLPTAPQWTGRQGFD